MINDARLPLLVTMGEPAGIGGEILMKSWKILWGSSQIVEKSPLFVAIDDINRLTHEAKRCGLNIPLQSIQNVEEAFDIIPHGLPILHRPLPAMPQPGQPDSKSVPAVMACIEEAVALICSGKAAGLVTNPVHKHILYQAGFAYPGHTEFLAALAEQAQTTGPPRTYRPVMMLVIPGLRVVPLTVHIPLIEVPRKLEHNMIVETGHIVATSLKQNFGILKPRLAMAGLNPHAGEGGQIGKEEQEILMPAIAQLRADGLTVSAPQPADSLFHKKARAHYDVVLCPYHDQALIPLKTLNFEEGVNITLGLPFLRTSPDHGTGLDIAGKGIASPISLIEALRLAARMAAASQTAANLSPAVSGAR